MKAATDITSEPLTSSSLTRTLSRMLSRIYASVGFREASDLPSSLPANWPLSSEEDYAAFPSRIIKIGEPQAYDFKDNFVKTSKYEIYNFLPKFMLEEFHYKTKVANCYFLMIAGLQCISAISNTNGIPTTLLPLTFVVVINGIFQSLEDLSRHRADKLANASITKRYDATLDNFVNVSWAELKVGDYVYICTRDIVPADIVLISVAEKYDPPQGLAYVETKSLDGETNLKIRSALPITLSKVRTPHNLSQLVGDMTMEHPNKSTLTFDGSVNLNELGRCKVSINNVILRGCVLRNTDWAIGLVVNTGHDTKIMMSSEETKGKTSNLEAMAGKEIIRIILLLACVCFAGATGSAIWSGEHDIKTIWYLGYLDNPVVSEWFIDFFYFFLLHATFIPVSLYVSMAVTRSAQSYFMNNDLDMYYEETDTPALVRTMTLNEELGQISHVFSDKTGTLTCNIMDFRKFSVDGVSYGLGITEIGRAAWKLEGKAINPSVLEGEALAKSTCKDIPHVSFYDPLYSKTMGEDGKQSKKLKQFFKLLSVCHDVIPEKINGKVKLSASNPDDEALVCAAAYFGHEFCDKRESRIVVNITTDYNNKKSVKVEEIELLEVIAFTSTRKRMSVIIRDSDGVIKLLMKGADTGILPRLKANQDELKATTLKHLKQYSVEGLRCLLVGYRELSEEEYASWSKQYIVATTSMTEISNRKEGKRNMIDDLEDRIESSLILLGATAIEDRLQDGVPECIRCLADAGVNIWMLTGDKEETAINIAVACNLVKPTSYMDHIIINPIICPTGEDILALILKELKKHEDELFEKQHNMSASIKPKALMIDGPSITTILDPRDTLGLMQMLLRLSITCKAVVACRVSPDQKRQMVSMVKVGMPQIRTLAIGDGANDVAMIQEAHVGVGIKGEEGVQAVNSADFAIAQFRYLSVLMLKHGRYNYIRMSYLVCYMFYKNVLMSMAQWWFNFSCGFSGQKYYTEGAIQLYNLAYTSIPILLFSIYDMDIEPENMFSYPKLYQSCVNNEYFSSLLFWRWIFTAMLESIVVSVLPLYFLNSSDVVQTTFWECGATCFTVIILVVSCKILFIQNKFYLFTFAMMFFSIALWFITAVFINSFVLIDFNWYNMFYRLLSTGTYYLIVLLLTSLIVGKDLFICAFERSFTYKLYQIIQEMQKYGSDKSTNTFITQEKVSDSVTPAGGIDL